MLRRGERAVLAALALVVVGTSCGQAARTASPPTTAIPSAPATVATDAARAHDATPPPGDVAIAPPPIDLGGSPPAGSTPCPPAPPAPAPTGSGTWAVVVGINRYPSGHFDLLSAVPDARDVDEALGRFGVPSDHRLVLTDEVATACHITAAADWLVAHAGPTATAVFFYAGHARKLGPGREAVIAADAATVADTELAQHLAGLRAARTWIAMSSCFGGGFDEMLAPGRVLTAAAGPNSIAYENEDFHRSYLVQYMVRKAMIEGAAPDTVQESYDWAAAALARDYPARVPFQIDRAGAAVDVHEPGAPRPAPAPRAAIDTRQSPAPAPPRAPTPTTPPTTAPEDNCRGLTLGVLKCH